MHDLVALLSGSISHIDGCQHLVLHLACQPRPRQATDVPTLLSAGSSTSVVDIDRPVEMVPQHAHLYVQPGPGDRYPTDFLQHLWSRIHRVSPAHERVDHWCLARLEQPANHTRLAA
jgi:hypothetical protein